MSGYVLDVEGDGTYIKCNIFDLDTGVKVDVYMPLEGLSPGETREVSESIVDIGEHLSTIVATGVSAMNDQLEGR